MGDSNFQISKGLLELLILKITEESLISSDDLKNYRKIILATTAHEKVYKAANEVRDSKCFKYLTCHEKRDLMRQSRILQESRVKGRLNHAPQVESGDPENDPLLLPLQKTPCRV